MFYWHKMKVDSCTAFASTGCVGKQLFVYVSLSCLLLDTAYSFCFHLCFVIMHFCCLLFVIQSFLLLLLFLNIWRVLCSKFTELLSSAPCFHWTVLKKNSGCETTTRIKTDALFFLFKCLKRLHPSMTRDAGGNHARIILYVHTSSL